MHEPGYVLVDVSMPMDAFTFPGDEPLEVIGPYNVLPGSNPEFVYRLRIDSQTGTHVQGPHYFLRDGARIDEIPLSRFEGWAHVVQVDKRGVDTTADDLRPQLDGRDLRGGIVVLRTGHMDELVAGAPLDPATRPGLSLEAVRYLVEGMGISMIAVDSVGVESRETENYEVNVYLCRHDVLILEGLVNLRALAGERLWLEAFPLRVSGVEGTPCRAVVRCWDAAEPAP